MWTIEQKSPNQEPLNFRLNNQETLDNLALFRTFVRNVHNNSNSIMCKNYNIYRTCRSIHHLLQESLEIFNLVDVVEKEPSEWTGYQHRVMCLVFPTLFFDKIPYTNGPIRQLKRLHYHKLLLEYYLNYEGNHEQDKYGDILQEMFDCVANNMGHVTQVDGVMKPGIKLIDFPDFPEIINFKQFKDAHDEIDNESYINRLPDECLKFLLEKNKDYRDNCLKQYDGPYIEIYNECVEKLNYVQQLIESI